MTGCWIKFSSSALRAVPAARCAVNDFFPVWFAHAGLWMGSIALRGLSWPLLGEFLGWAHKSPKWA